MAKTTLPRTDFTAATATDWPGTLLPCRDLWSGSALNDSALNATPVRRAGWATLFAYMHRRFGPPHMGGDDYKDLSAGWMLTTPDPEVFVAVSPSVDGPGFSFSPYVAFAREDDGRMIRARDLKLSFDRIVAIRQAYKDALVDLLRPVSVRDSDINALGELGESARDETLLACDEDTGEPVYKAPYHPSSGYAMPPGLFGGEDWATLCPLIRNLGAGDMTAGRSKLIALLQDQVLNEAAKAPWPVQRLILLAAGKHRQELCGKFKLDAAALKCFEAEWAALSAKESPKAIIAEMTDEAVDAAIGFLSRLGYGNGDLPATVKRYRIRAAVEDIWDELTSLAQDDFPNEALPEGIGRLGAGLPDALKAGFAACGRDDLVEWVNRAVARPGGPGALFQVAWYLNEQSRKKQATEVTETSSSPAP